MSDPAPLPPRSLDTKRILARNTAWNYAGFATNLASNLVVFPFVVSSIGEASSGVWVLIGAVTGYLGLLELGLVPSLVQSVAAALARGDHDRVNRLASTAQVLLVALGLIPILLSFASPRIVTMLSIPPEVEPTAVLALRLAMIGFGMRMPLAALQALLLAAQRQDRSNQLWILLAGVKAAATFALLLLGQGLVAIVAMEALVHLLAGVLQLAWVRQEHAELRMSLRLVGLDDVRDLVSFGSIMLLNSMTRLVSEQTDRLVIGAFLPIALVTHYSAGWKIFQAARNIPLTLVQAVGPLTADYHGRGDSEGLRTLMLRMTKYSVALVWAVAVPLAIGAPFLLRIWMGQNFMSSATIVRILVVSFVVTAHNHVGYSCLVGMRRVGPVLWRYRIPEAVLNLVFSIVLVQYLGIVGVALGTMLPALLLEYVFLRFLFTELNVAPADFFRSVVRPTALPATVAFSPLLVVGALADPAGPMPLVAALIASLVYGWLFWRTQLTPIERTELVTHLPLPARVKGPLTTVLGAG